MESDTPLTAELAQKAKALLEDADGIKLRATGNAVPSLLQIVEELQGEGTAEVLDIKTSSRQGQKPGDIVQADLSFIDDIHLREHLSPTRSNGLVSMINQMKSYAARLAQ